MRVVAIALVVAITSIARADTQGDLAEARRLEAALEYDKALVIVDRVIANGGATRENLVELHMLAGRLAAGLDREQVAEDHFARALALAPATSLPEGTSPKIMRPFESARTRSVALRVRGAVDRGVATITVESDPLGLVAGMAVKLSGSGEVREPQGRRIELPAQGHATDLIALDAYGNQVWSQPVAMTAPPLVTRARPFYKNPWLWGSLFIVSTGVGVVGAVQLTSAQNEWNALNDGMHDYSELHAIETRGKSWGVAANLGFGLAVVTGIATTWLIVTGRSSSSSIAVLAGGDMTGLAVTGDF